MGILPVPFLCPADKRNLSRLIPVVNDPFQKKHLVAHIAIKYHLTLKSVLIMWEGCTGDSECSELNTRNAGESRILVQCWRQGGRSTCTLPAPTGFGNMGWDKRQWSRTDARKKFFKRDHQSTGTGCWGTQQWNHPKGLLKLWTRPWETSSNSEAGPSWRRKLN